MFFSEAMQHLNRIVADGKNGNVLALEVRQGMLQLNELCLAKGSPTGATVENHQRASVAPRLVKRHYIAMLVRQCDVREMFPNGRANTSEVHTKIRDCGHMLSL
jgi:hypothetical protein